MKFSRIIILTIVLVALLAACQTNDQPTGDTPEPEHTATGGVPDPAEHINVKDIDIVQEGDNTVIKISLLSGSRQNGYNESKLAELPEYSITLLEKPERLKITLDNISFWDYEQKESWELSSFAVGLFREVPADNDTLILYVQLTQNATFSKSEVDGDLVITLMPEESDQQAKYFCVADGFLEYQDGTWPDNIEMQPVLCSDGINKLLISRAFTTETEASDFAAQNNIELHNTFLEKDIYVVSLQSGTLPNHEIGENEITLEDYSAVLSEGVMIDTPTLLENGKYLASSIDGRIAFSRRYKPEEPSMEQDVYLSSEKVWILESNGRKTELDVPEFFSVDEAAFSYDGKFLAILDASIENSVLYVYDFESETPLYNLGEEGFGSLTDSFAWSDTSNTIYAMTGSDPGSIQLMGCEFTKDGRRIFAVEEQAGGAGSLAVANNKLYFADRTILDGGMVYEITDTRVQMCTGVDIKASASDNIMLVLESFSTGGEERTTNLKLCNIDTKECEYIVQSAEIEDYEFSFSSGKVFYTIPAQEPVGDYQFEFVSYDIVTGVSEVVALTSSSQFEIASEPGIVYFIKEIIETEQIAIATFIYNLNKGE